MLFGFRKKIFQWDTKGNLNHIEAWEDFLGRAARGISMDLYKNRLNNYAVVMSQYILWDKEEKDILVSWGLHSFCISMIQCSQLSGRLLLITTCQLGGTFKIIYCFKQYILVTSCSKWSYTYYGIISVPWWFNILKYCSVSFC